MIIISYRILDDQNKRELIGFIFFFSFKNNQLSIELRV